MIGGSPFGAAVLRASSLGVPVLRWSLPADGSGSSSSLPDLQVLTGQAFILVLEGMNVCMNECLNLLTSLTTSILFCVTSAYTQSNGDILTPLHCALS